MTLPVDALPVLYRMTVDIEEGTQDKELTLLRGLLPLQGYILLVSVDLRGEHVWRFTSLVYHKHSLKHQSPFWRRLFKNFWFFNFCWYICLFTRIFQEMDTYLLISNWALYLHIYGNCVCTHHTLAHFMWLCFKETVHLIFIVTLLILCSAISPPPPPYFLITLHWSHTRGLSWGGLQLIYLLSVEHHIYFNGTNKISQWSHDQELAPLALNQKQWPRAIDDNLVSILGSLSEYALSTQPQNAISTHVQWLGVKAHFVCRIYLHYVVSKRLRWYS